MNPPAPRAQLTSQFSRCAVGFLALCIANCAAASAQQNLQIDPAHSSVKLTLGAALHTVHGAFQLKSGMLVLDRFSKKISGQIIADAKSGVTGNGMRDRKMHKDVLESEKYPEISFRPEAIDGSIAAQGKSSVQVHGVFTIHGTDHQITVPAEVELGEDHWTATSHFIIPYAAWGIKNPSTLFLHVSDSAEMEITVAGTISKADAASGQ